MADLAAGGPQHVAIIMDGNGRWARARGRPRGFGHRAGGRAARANIEHASDIGLPALTLYAFSSENWRRPASEVSLLMELLLGTLRKELNEFHRRGARLRFIGDRSRFSPDLREEMSRGEALTATNAGLCLNIALGYGAQQDLTRVMRELAAEVAAGRLRAEDINEERIAARLALGELPDVDLFVRTGGEVRLSNFLLWELAYTELYFSQTFWPDFGPADLDAAIDWYRGRERRFGMVEASACS